MPQEVFRQGNFTNGDLDPQMLGRRDLKVYSSSFVNSQNMMLSPQGPMSRRPGLAFVGRVRGPISAIALTAGMISMPNGGTAAECLTGGDDGPATTTPMATGAPYVVLEIDLGAPTVVSLVDVTDIAVVAAGGGGGAIPTPPPPVHLPFPGGFTFGPGGRFDAL
ncbi:MAG TPA: hypothetical protein VFC47_11285 [Caulobacteraceae bacterium]|nr:hypothetical protein [Caulobacteraceae bacterium]